MSAHTNIKGKRIRKQAFSKGIVFVISATIGAILFTTLYALTLFTFKTLLTLYAFCIVICLYALILLKNGNEVLCILSDDRLYYFGATYDHILFSFVSGIKRTTFEQDGWILYSAIHKHECRPSILGLGAFITLSGEDFELTVSGVSKHFISQIENAKKKCATSYSEERYGVITPPTIITRNGFWKELWEYCENNSLENILRCDEITRIYFEENIDCIDIELTNRGRDILINMDNERYHILPADDNDDVEQIIEYKDLAGIEDLFAKMRDFIDHNS